MRQSLYGHFSTSAEQRAEQFVQSFQGAAEMVLGLQRAPETRPTPAHTESIGAQPGQLSLSLKETNTFLSMALYEAIHHDPFAETFCVHRTIHPTSYFATEHVISSNVQLLVV